MTETDYERERAVVGDLSALDRTATTFRLDAARGRTGTELLSFLELVRGEDPSEPFWRAVQVMSAGDRDVEIVLSDSFTPRLLPVGRVHVECNLFDDEALARADARTVVAKHS